MGRQGSLSLYVLTRRLRKDFCLGLRCTFVCTHPIVRVRWRRLAQCVLLLPPPRTELPGMSVHDTLARSWELMGLPALLLSTAVAQKACGRSSGRLRHQRKSVDLRACASQRNLRSCLFCTPNWLAPLPRASATTRTTSISAADSVYGAVSSHRLSLPPRFTECTSPTFSKTSIRLAMGWFCIVLSYQGCIQGVSLVPLMLLLESPSFISPRLVYQTAHQQARSILETYPQLHGLPRHSMAIPLQAQHGVNVPNLSGAISNPCRSASELPTCLLLPQAWNLGQ